MRPAAPSPEALARGLGAAPAEALKGPSYMAVFRREAEAAALAPDFAVLAGRCPRAVIATAAGETCDFVSRYFAPARGIDEDPATGSSHRALAPCWAARLGRRRLLARQLLARGGVLRCEDRAARALVGGRAALAGEDAVPVAVGGSRADDRLSPAW